MTMFSWKDNSFLAELLLTSFLEKTITDKQQLNIYDNSIKIKMEFKHH